MPRVISSSFTFFFKFVFPTVWLGGFAFATCGLILSALFNANAEQRAAAQVACIPFALATLVGGAVLYEFCMRLKRVALDEGHLLISNYVSEVSVPLSDIETVTEIVWINIHPVTVTLRTETPLGKKIMFMPHSRLFDFFQSHPVVGELNELAAEAKSAAA